MAFKKINRSTSSVSSPESLIFDLPRRKIPGVLAHQADVMRRYATLASDKSDVALQLPTGSGKTLVGCLIGEWIRRSRGEKVIYLAPTRQLVNQVTWQCENRYGIQTASFTGSAREYSSDAKSEYRTGNRIGVTTYSSLFNNRPFFSDADTIILDDAHASENYVASMWSVLIKNKADEHAILFSALRSIISPFLDGSSKHKIFSTKELNNGWTEKLPTPTLLEIEDEIRAALDSHTADTELRYTWSAIRDNLSACHVYFNESEMLIRPLIPPTWTHQAFSNARHRIYMSATLGAGGDLERLFGRRSIYRVSAPKEWDRQGVGRRLFLFPGLSLDDRSVEDLNLKLISRSERALILVPSDADATRRRDSIESSLGFKTLSARDIEATKAPFVENSKVVAVVANRYDGIDFPGEDCRLMFVEGLPTTMNLQERFLMSRMGANALFNERVQTRVLQAVGRCTRSLEDYSAVVINGSELQDYLVDVRKRRHLHPDIQAEIQFGVEQSRSSTASDFTDFYSTFLANGSEWEAANQDIISIRNELEQEELPSISELSKSVSDEVRYQEFLWQGDYLNAMDSAGKVLSHTTGADLRGYRALWNYLAGSAATLAQRQGTISGDNRARQYFADAKNAAVGLRWLINLGTERSAPSLDDKFDSNLLEQVENIERLLSSLGLSHERRYAEREKEILEGLRSSKDFERAQVLLGELLGFYSRKVDSDGSPDPWWHLGKHVIVFEDHAGADKTSLLSAEKSRQAAGHINWLRENETGLAGSEIITVLVTPVSRSSHGAKPHLREVFLWPLDEFIQWSSVALATIREIRKSLSETNDLAWRSEAANMLKERKLDIISLSALRRTLSAADGLHFS